MKTFLAYGGLLFLKLTFIPNVNMLAWLFIAMLVDFITGFLKAKALGQDRTSSAMRKSIIKLIQYVCAIVVVIILGNSLGKEVDLIKYADDGVLIFLLYIEAVSIFENLAALSPDSVFTKRFAQPILKLLTLSMDKTAIGKLSATQEKTTMVLAIVATAVLASCTIVKPTTTETKSKTDSTIVTNTPVNFKYEGATVQAKVNYDSLVKIAFEKWKQQLPVSVANTNNVDSLLKAFKASLKLPASPKQVVTDSSSKAELQWWIDEYGTLTMSCTSKDQTIQLMTTEITRLTKEVIEAKKVQVIKEMPNWGWIVIGMLSTLLLVAVVVIVVLFSINKKFK